MKVKPEKPALATVPPRTRVRVLPLLVVGRTVLVARKRPVVARLLDGLVLPLFARAKLIWQRVLLKKKPLHKPVLPHKLAWLVAPNARVLFVRVVVVPAPNLYFWLRTVAVVAVKVVKPPNPLRPKQHRAPFDGAFATFVLYPVLLVVARVQLVNKPALPQQKRVRHFRLVVLVAPKLAQQQIARIFNARFIAPLCRRPPLPL